MGCGASTSNVAKPGTHGGTDDHKKKDTQTTYRERLGEDFIIDFAKSQDNIKDLGRRRSAGTGRLRGLVRSLSAWYLLELPFWQTEISG